jgi:predicted transcriptional regulator
MLDACELRSRSKTPTVANSRALFAAFAVERYGASATHVANLLGKNPGSVSRWLNRARGWLDEPEVRSKLDSLDEHIRTEHAGTTAKTGAGKVICSE